MTDIFVGIASRLKEERLKTGLDQDGFARLGGASAQTQMRYETNQALPKLEYLRALSVHGVDPAYVITGIRAGANLPPDEQLLLDKYQSLADGKKDVAHVLISSLLDQTDDELRAEAALRFSTPTDRRA